MIGPTLLRRSGSKPYGSSPAYASDGITGLPMNPDFSELLLTFNAHHVEYLLVGAHALAVYGWELPGFVPFYQHILPARFLDLAAADHYVLHAS
jgi:hypothetical protein